MAARPSPSRTRPPQPVPAAVAVGPDRLAWLKSSSAASICLRVLIVALAGYFVLAMYSPAVGDTDTWWHLKTGQYIWQQHRLPVPDPFSYTTYMGKPLYPGEPMTRYFNLTHEWLAQIFLYAAYAFDGFRGLVLMRAFALTLFGFLAGCIVYQRSRSFHRALLGGAAPWMVVSRFNGDRPQYFTYVLLMVAILILDGASARWQSPGSPKPESPDAWNRSRRLWLLPPLMLFWANCHGGFFLGWIVIGAYCAEDLFCRWRSRNWGKLNPLWAAGVSAILVSGLNPNFYNVIPVMRSYRLSQLQSQIWEWRPPMYWELTPFTVLLYAGIIVLLWRFRHVRPAHWLLMAAFSVAALTAYRNIIFGSAIAAIMIATYLPRWHAKSGWADWLLPAAVAIAFAAGAYPQSPYLFSAGVALCALLIWRGLFTRSAEVALVGLLAMAAYTAHSEDIGFQFHANDWSLPAATADFLLQHHIKGRIFNTYGQGGYLIWRLYPEQQVFLDGRALNESVYQDSQRITMNAAGVNGKSGDQLLKDYNIDVIVMDAFESVTGMPYYLPAALADPSQHEWKLVYHDVHDVIYMRHPPPDVRVLDSFDALAGMEDQCKFYMQHGEPACARGMAAIFFQIGDQARGRKWADLFNQSDYKPSFEVAK